MLVIPNHVHGCANRIIYGTLSRLRKLNGGSKGLLHIHLNFLAFKKSRAPQFRNFHLHIYSTKHICGKKTDLHCLLQGILIQWNSFYSAWTVLPFRVHYYLYIYIYTQYALYCHHIITLLYAYVNHYIVIPMTYPLFIHPIIVG